MAHIVEGVDQVLPGKDGTIENDWVIHELKTTANFARNNRFLNWYIGGLNFQIEHHLFPKKLKLQILFRQGQTLLK